MSSNKNLNVKTSGQRHRSRSPGIAVRVTSNDSSSEIKTCKPRRSRARPSESPAGPSKSSAGVKRAKPCVKLPSGLSGDVKSVENDQFVTIRATPLLKVKARPKPSNPCGLIITASDSPEESTQMYYTCLGPAALNVAQSPRSASSESSYSQKSTKIGVDSRESSSETVSEEFYTCTSGSSSRQTTESRTSTTDESLQIRATNSGPLSPEPLSANANFQFYTIAPDSPRSTTTENTLQESQNLTVHPVGLRKRSRSRDGRVLEAAVAKMEVKELKNPEAPRKRSSDAVQAAQKVNRPKELFLGGSISLQASIRDFKKLQEIGRGSFGSVAKVQHKNTAKMYALKYINNKVSDWKYIEAEIQVMFECTHFNIVRLYGWFLSADKKTVHLMMELCEGGDLYTFLENQKGVLLSEKKILEWFHQIASAVKYLHDKKIMHRDVKPKNILFADADHLKVADFGISKILGPNGAATTAIGTPLYMAPEIWSKGNISYSYKSDIWSLGCVLVNMATLGSCFEDGISHIKAKHRKISRKYIVVPGVVSMCIQICPLKRATAHQLLVAVNSTSKSQ